MKISENNNANLDKNKYEPTMIVGFRKDGKFYTCSPNCYHIEGDYEDKSAKIICSYFKEELDNSYFDNEVIKPCSSCIKKLFDL